MRKRTGLDRGRSGRGVCRTVGRLGGLRHDPRRPGHPGTDAGGRGRFREDQEGQAGGRRPVRIEGDPGRRGNQRRSGPGPRRARLPEPVPRAAGGHLRLPAAGGRGRGPLLVPGRRAGRARGGQEAGRGPLRVREGPGRGPQGRAVGAGAAGHLHAVGGQHPAGRHDHGTRRIRPPAEDRSRPLHVLLSDGRRAALHSRAGAGRAERRARLGPGHRPGARRLADHPCHAPARHAQRQRRPRHRQARRRHAHPRSDRRDARVGRSEEVGDRGGRRPEEQDGGAQQGLRRRVPAGRQRSHAGHAGPPQPERRLLHARAPAQVEDRNRRADLARGDPAAGHQRLDGRHGHQPVAGLRRPRARRAQPAGHLPRHRLQQQDAGVSRAGCARHARERRRRAAVRPRPPGKGGGRRCSRP